MELIFFMPASYEVKAAKKHKINLELSKTEYPPKKHLKANTKMQTLSTEIFK